MKGSDAENVCYLRDIGDANTLVDLMKSFPGGNAVVIGGGYIGMECAASLVINKINVTMVFPEEHCSNLSFPIPFFLPPPMVLLYVYWFIILWSKDLEQSELIPIKFVMDKVLQSEIDYSLYFYFFFSGSFIYTQDSKLL